MAFNSNASAASSAKTANTGNFEPALGFINVDLPDETGALIKLGVFTLKASEDTQQDMYDALKGATPEQEEQILQWVKDNIRLNFRPNIKASQGRSFGFKSALKLV